MKDSQFVLAEQLYKKVTDGTHDSPKPQAEGFPLVTSKNIKGGVLDISTANLISKEDYDNINKRSKVEKWDVIISMIGEYCGYTYIEKNNEINYAVKNVGLFKTGSGLEANWLTYYLQSDYGKYYLQQVKSGSSQPYLSLGALRKLPILNPSDEIKQGIVNILSALDNKIEINNRISEELEKMTKMLYDYWFVQFDFPNNHGNPYKAAGGKMMYNELLKREIPAGWELKKLGDFVNAINTGLNPRDHFKLGDGENYYITIKNIEYGRIIISSSCDKINDDALARIQQRSKLEKGDILFTSIEPVGKTFLLLENPKDWNINESVFSFKPDYNVVTSEYLFMLLSSEEVKIKCRNASTGSIHKGIRITPLKEFTFAYPSIDTINSFTKLINPILEKINSAQKQNQQLSALRDWLLPMLMNGQVKVDSSGMPTSKSVEVSCPNF